MTPDDDPLDRWLAAARWPEAGPERERRILARWRRPVRRWPVAAVMVAAAAAVLAVWLSPRPVEIVKPSTTIAVLPAPPPPAPMARAATPREVAVLVAARHPTAAKPTEPPRPPSATELFERGDPRSLGAFLAAVADPERRVAALAIAASSRKPPTNALLAALGDSRTETRRAAARVLGQLDDATVAPRLAALLTDVRRRRDALAALAASPRPAAAAVLAAAARSRELAPLVRAALDTTQ